MEVATSREAVNLSNNTKAITPKTLKDVLGSYATLSYVMQALSEISVDPSQVDLSAYALISSIPTNISQLNNDDNYVQTVGGLIPSTVLPSYVDDVLEYSNSSQFPNPGDLGIIYVDTNTNLTYRWTGSMYTEISKSLALGELSSTAYRGDRGKIAYDHSQSQSGNPHNVLLSDLGITISSDTINYLSGLSDNIITLLGQKLNTSGGSLTGFLSLHAKPTDRIHAATKGYVDDEINGISISVTQYVERTSTLETTVAGIVTTQSQTTETITSVQNAVSGIDQRTDSLETLTASTASSLSATITEYNATKTTVTELAETVENMGDTSQMYLHIVYSANSNGSSFTTTAQPDTKYIGMVSTNSETPPISESAYSWVKIKGDDGADGADGTQGTSSYIHIKYSDDGVEFTPIVYEEDGITIIYNLGEKPGAYIGQYIDSIEEDSAEFTDYKWYKFTASLDSAINGRIELIENNYHLLDDKLTTTFYTKEETDSKITEGIEGWKLDYQKSGGNNLLRNTALYFTHENDLDETIFDYWDGPISKIIDGEYPYDLGNTFNSVSGTAIVLNNGTTSQTISVGPGIYSLAFKVKQNPDYTNATASCNVNDSITNNIKLYGIEVPVNSIELSNNLIVKCIVVINSKSTYQLNFVCDTNNGFIIYDLMLNYGDELFLPYSQNMNETKTSCVSISENIVVESSTEETKAVFGAKGVVGYNINDSSIAFQLTKYGSFSNEVRANSALIANLSIKKNGNQTWLSTL